MKPSSLCAAVAAALAFASCGSASPEELLSVELSPEEVTLHEPVFVEIALKNDGPGAVEADFGVAKIGAFRFEIAPETGGEVKKIGSPVGPTMFHTGSKVELRPGEHYRARHLLTEWLRISSPGKYAVNVRFTGTVTNESSEKLPVAREFSLPLTVRPRDPERLRELGVSLLETACQSRDLDASQNAAKELGHLDDTAITSFLVEMLGCGYLAQVEAVAGLVRLGTAEALEALIVAAEGGDQDLAQVARIALRSQISRRGPQLEPGLRRRIEEVLPD